MKPRNALVARLGLSALLSSGLLLTPALAWADDGGTDAADDAPIDAPSTGAAGTSGAAGTGGAAGVSGDGGIKTDGSVLTDGGSDGPRPDGGAAGTSGAAGTAVVIPEDDAGCSTVGGSNDTPTGLFALFGAGAAFFGVGYWRRRRAGR